MDCRVHGVTELDSLSDLQFHFQVPWGASQVVLVIRSLSASAEDVRDAGSIPGLGRSPRGGNGNPLQYSCLENPMDRGAWQGP